MSRPKAFVTGWPIAHSRSPLIHRFWLDRYRIDGDYLPQAVPTQEFEPFLRSFADRGFVGGNVTIPHKEAAFRACDEVTGVARQIGAVNTLWLEDGRLRGDNTDAYGFSANLDEHVDWRGGRTAIVVGAGGASRAVVHSLLDAEFDPVWVLNRTAGRAESLAGEFGPGIRSGGLGELSRMLPMADLVVNTTPAGMAGQGGLEVDWSNAQSSAIAADIVYVPLVTPFLQGAARFGLRTVDGLGMLLHQAVPGFERWFGRRPEVDAELRRLVVADIER